MRTLVIDTATAACSVALIERGEVIAERHVLVERGHAERLVPMIAELPDGGRAQHVLVDVGPGSFTGIRVGIAAARGLRLGWGTSVAGYSSLALIAAAAAAHERGDGAIAAVLEGGHGEVFMQVFAPDPLRPLGDLRSLTPAAARAALTGLRAVGDGLRWLTSDDPRRAARGELPRAADAILLPPGLAQMPPRPLYGRAPDAKPVPSSAAGGVEGLPA